MTTTCTSCKTYFVTNQQLTKLPIEFISSKNPKYIVVQNCRCVYANDTGYEYLTADIQVHADFIERDQYLDSFVCFTNTIMTKYKKWEVKNPRQNMKVWFTDMEGNLMNNIKSFVLELLLIY
jgi:hypothetical protein